MPFFKMAPLPHLPLAVVSTVKAATKEAAVCGAQRSVVSTFAACYVVLFPRIFCLCAAA